MWSDADDAIIGGDLTAALGYVTPAGGVVLAAVAPIGLRDRDAGTVAFTTSLGLGKKLERLRRDPRVALAYHAREHGLGPQHDRRFVLVQGTASFSDEAPPRDALDRIGAQAEPFMGPPRRGPFWDRWLQAYYVDRIQVTVAVERVLHLPEEPPPPAAPAQSPPRNGAAPRVDCPRAARRLQRTAHHLLGWRGADGFPIIAPVTLGAATPAGIPVGGDVPLPEGGRRAGLLGHSYHAQLVGLHSRTHTGWLQDGVYAPHTESGFVTPRNKTLVLLINGLMARRGLKKAMAGRVASGVG
jgi:Pyridoxamine 5'-phosphate oxidase